MTKNSHAINETRHSTKADGKETAGFVPTRDELVELVKYWVTKAIDDNYFIFWGQCKSAMFWRTLALSRSNHTLLGISDPLTKFAMT